ncbi:MAG: hypothetical protein HYV97_06110 [Bdellovibrio sp.]|nr:hypothetical protein [Bdellovibrio sp.]
MKTTRIITLFVLIIWVFAVVAGDWSSGGGDPVIVQTYPFPNQSLLQDALDLLEVRIKETVFIDEFKTAFKSELNLLHQKNNFFYIPQLFSVGLGRYPGDYTKLVSNGAMTEFTSGAPIYFSRQVLEYDARTLARVIAQEIPHHIFKSNYRDDEIFVNTLGTYIIVGGEIPNSPVPLARVIHEEFSTIPNAALRSVVKEAARLQTNDFGWHRGLYFLSHQGYRQLGSFDLYNVEYIYEPVSEFTKRTHVLNLKFDMDILSEMISRCVFISYTQGPSGITGAEQKMLTDLFIQHLRAYPDIFKKIYYLEQVVVPTNKKLTTCAIGVEGPDQHVMLFQSVYRHEDDVHGPNEHRPEKL